ncbi:MAG: p-hydroxybenzoic acid efflux pump subunit AaeA [Bacteroidota bacterium]|jgi:RND family efflux transporter MFP subunit|nr:MAG: p-hydroxybenzoic acid efflux pump subunit AaeA [Bacteroidota bacterium]
MKIMVINLLKHLASLLTILFFLSLPAYSQDKESRALVVASQEAILSSELAARIENIAVKEMQRFNKGDLLIQFDCSLYEAQKDVVSANSNSALIKLKSDEQMLQMRSIGKYELELSISEYEKAKSELRIAELNVERCQIKAPFDGAVEEVIVNTYETIQPQVELMKIIQTDILELEMVVSSEWVSWLKIGHPIKVYIDEIQKEFNASISGIGANVDAVSQTIQLKGTITDASPALLPGMSGRVVF